MRNRLILLLSVVLLVAAVPMLAQVTAQLQGQATSDGAPLPGVTVTISSPNLQGTRTAVTDANGRYVFAALPPGAYSVVFDLTGMQPVTKKATLALNTTNKVDAAMMLSSVAEAIVVTATAPAVMETSQVASNFAQSEIEELPVARNVMAIALLSPGVNDNTASTSQLQISGSPGYDNLVMVNGVPITENVRSQAMTLYIEDAIQETTVLTGSVSAEWGRFTGGVVNSITKSGGNEFSGSLRANLDNPSWAEERPGEIINIDKVNKTYQATLGGYIMKDRLWFFLAGHDAETSDAVQTFRLNIPLSRNSTVERYEYKLTGQLTQKHSLVGSYFTSDRATENTWYTSANIYDVASTYNRKDPEELLSAHYNGMITSNLLLEGHYSQRAWDVSVGGGSAYTDMIKGTLALNRADGNARFNSPTFCGVCDTETRDNEGYTLKTNYYLTTGSLGTHNIVGGFESFSEMRHANNYQSGSNFRLYFTNVLRQPGSQVPLTNANGDLFPVTGSNTFIRWTPIFSLSNTDNNMSTDSLFVNDRWDLSNRWSFNVGLRYDKNDAVDADGNVASDDAAISPRLTAIFDPMANGKHRITAAYNRYVSRVLEGPGTAMETSGSPATIDFNYRGPAINNGSPTDPLTTAQALQLIWDWFNSACKASDPTKCGTANSDLYRGSPSIPGLSTIFQETLKSPSVDEFILGYGTQFSNAYMKVDLIHREWTDFFAYRIDQTTPRATDANGAIVDIAVAENTNLAERTYDGLQFQSAWRPSQRINIGVNYTWAKLKGNDEQESSTSGTVGNSPGAIYYPEFQNYANEQPSGYLSYDQRHRVRAWIGYDIPMPEVIGTLNVSLLQNFDSGTAYSASGTIDLEYDGAPDPASTNYGGPPVEGTYFFSDRGAYRRPDITRTDIALNYGRRLFRNLELFAEGELLNAFNNDDFINNNATIYTANNGQTNCPGCVTFNPFTETPVEGVHWVKGPNFGKPTAASHYQTARTYRFSLGLRF